MFLERMSHFFFYLNPPKKELQVSNEYSTEKSQCSTPIIFTSQLWKWEREGQDAKSKKLRIKATHETGLARGSRAQCVESQAKPSSTRTAASSQSLQTPLAHNSSAFWLHHIAPFNSTTTSVAQLPALTLLCCTAFFPPCFLCLINISLFQHPGLHQPVAKYGCAVL